MAKHAYLSASASHRWLACPPSAKLCAQEEDRGSPYAQQGTDAHELCQYLVEKALGYNVRDPTEDLTWYDAEMQEAAEGYCSFVMEQVEEAKKLCPDPLVCVEQTLDFSKWVEHGFGTGDAVIVADGLLQIVDMKYGTGIKVSASTSQLRCYALGCIDMFDGLYDIKNVRIVIYQPRLSNIDECDMTKEELLKWADEVLVPAASLAFIGGGEYSAGSHCQFCCVKAYCRKRTEYNLEAAKYDFKMPPTLEDKEIAALLPKLDKIKSWATDLQEYALKKALSGTKWGGYKLVEGKANRKYKDEVAVAATVQAAGFDPYKRTVLGITAMTSMLGKQRFNDLLGDLVVRPQGKPTLVPVEDERPEMNLAADDFKEE